MHSIDLQPRRNRLRLPILIGCAALMLSDCGQSSDGGWQTSTDKNPVADVINVYVAVLPSSGNVGALTVRCQNGQTDLVIATPQKVSGDTTAVTVRFDDAAADEPAQWYTLSGNMGVASPHD